jgi:hypothetical protein
VTDVFHKLRTREAELAALILRAQAELTEIRTYLERGEKLAERAAEPGLSVPRPQLRKSVDYAEHVLKTYGPQLTLPQILKQMTELGWISSGDYRRVYRAMHLALSSNKKRFRHVGKLWELEGEANTGKLSRPPMRRS